MSNSAIITTENGWKDKTNNIGVYLHWNGGRDSIEPFLTYCKLKGYISPEVGECRYWVGLMHVLTNFFNGESYLEINTVDKLVDIGCDNGVYIIKDWKIVGRKMFCGEEETGYELLDFMELIDRKMPEKEKLGFEKLNLYSR